MFYVCTLVKAFRDRLAMELLVSFVIMILVKILVYVVNAICFLGCYMLYQDQVFMEFMESPHTHAHMANMYPPCHIREFS